jgi:hypothetical protein
MHFYISPPIVDGGLSVFLQFQFAFFQMADRMGGLSRMRIMRHHDDRFAQFSVEALKHSQDIVGG